MSLVEFPRCTPSLLRLEDRCTPAIMVTNTDWDSKVNGSLPWAIEKANEDIGQDEIQFDWNALGTNTPVFTADADETIGVTDGVIIQAGGGGVYAKFTGFRPFAFNHIMPREGVITESVINGGYFDSCAPEAGGDGGAVKLMFGSLSLNYNRFINNQALNGGAVYMHQNTTVVVGAAQGMPPVPEDFPETGGSSAVLFKGNQSALHGGAIQNFGGQLKLHRAAFYSNHAPGGSGGGVNVMDMGTLVVGPAPPPFHARIPEVKFVGNTASDNGGAICLMAAGKSSIVEANFTKNTAGDDGGAVFSSGDLTITGGFFIENDAAGWGGGIYVDAGTVNAFNVAFIDNTAGWWPQRHYGGPGTFNDVGCTYQG